MSQLIRVKADAFVCFYDTKIVLFIFPILLALQNVGDGFFYKPCPKKPLTRLFDFQYPMGVIERKPDLNSRT